MFDVRLATGSKNVQKKDGHSFTHTWGVAHPPMAADNDGVDKDGEDNDGVEMFRQRVKS